MFRVGEKVDLDLSAKYNMIVVGEENSWDQQSTSIDYFGIMLGVWFGLN
jgi:hypothetical protein